MEINETTRINSYSPKTEVKSVKSSSRSSYSEVENQDGSTSQAKVQDSFTKQNEVKPTDTGIYSKESINRTIEELEEQRTQAFISMIQKMLEAQGNSGGLSVAEITKNITGNFSAEDIEAAKKAVEDGGFYSVDAVSTRIMDMAMALAGDDPSKISTLRDAVMKGFGMAADAFGLKEEDMPEITRKTYQEVMKRFDDWEDSYKKDEDTTSNKDTTGTDKTDK